MFNSSYGEADIVLFGSPFDGTASHRPGSRFAPQAIRTEFEGLESYSPYFDCDLDGHPIHDGGDLPLYAASTNVLDVLAQINAHVDQLIGEGKRPFMLGGDHLTTLPAIQAAHAHHPDLCVIHIDAHTDLADTLYGEKISHGTVMRRTWESLGDNRIFQLGIRSGTKEEFIWGAKHTSFNPFTLKAIDHVIDEIGERPVYLTLDVDVLDPSVMPGTGTPEPGGLFFHELLEALQKCQALHLIGADLVELAPHYDPTYVSSIVAAKLVREIGALMVNCRHASHHRERSRRETASVQN